MEDFFESDLIGVDYVLPTILWTKYFLEQQLFDMATIFVYQDNISGILSNTNGNRKYHKFIENKIYQNPLFLN